MERVLFSGVGGQGVLLMGTLLAQAALDEGFISSWVPYYGLEMRGGRAKCWVVVSDSEIPSPVFSKPTSAVFLSDKFLSEDIDKVEPGGFILLNEREGEGYPIARKDVEPVRLWATGIASELGASGCANMVALGAYVSRKRLVRLDTLRCLLDTVVEDSSMREANVRCLLKGSEFGDAGMMRGL